MGKDQQDFVNRFGGLEMTDNQLILEVIRRFGYETDNDGQVLVFTGLYKDDDGNIVAEENQIVPEG
tara:strand:+ start:237 stop:434 length:198 start_codon:yes stop_codon:yes gene_type:complete